MPGDTLDHFPHRAMFSRGDTTPLEIYVLSAFPPEVLVPDVKARPAHSALCTEPDLVHSRSGDRSSLAVRARTLKIQPQWTVVSGAVSTRIQWHNR